MVKLRVGSFAQTALPVAHVLLIVVLALGLVPWMQHGTNVTQAAGGLSVFVNEIHYDNAGTDSGEAIEVAGPAGTDLTGWTIVLYNGSNGAMYDTDSLPTPIPNTCGGFGVVTINYPSNGIQNGAPDGLALVDNIGTVQQFLSYEGTLVATDGPASGLTSTDIGVAETSSTAVGDSLQLQGTGQYYEDFTWAGPMTATFDSCNTGQTFTGTGGDAAPTVSSTSPADTDTNVALGANVTVNFSEAVDVTGDWFVMSCSVSGNRAPSMSNVAVSGGPQSFTIDPDSNFQYADSCTVIVYAVQVSDQDTDDPPDNMAANYVFSFTTPDADPCEASFMPTYTIQGSGSASAYDGSIETTMGVVTASFQDTSDGRSGFYVQDATGDSNVATSDGLFIYDNGFGVPVSAGDLVRVTGTVDEYYGLTEITSVTNVMVCSTGSVGSMTVNLPIPDAVNPADFWEPYENMLITIPQTLTVTETYELGRYGQILLSSGGRLWEYTHTNTPSVAGYADHLDENAHRTVYLDDHNNTQNPDPIIHPAPELTASNTVRGGDTVAGLTGTLMYTFNDWVIDPIAPVTFVPVNPRPETTPAVGGTVTVASFNVLNYFSTIDHGPDVCGPSGDMDCRGADSDEEFTRQRDKIIAALTAINADVVGLMEIENNSTAAVEDLVNGLNGVLGAGTYAYVDTGIIGTDAIKVALIYKPGTVSLAGDFAILDSSVDPLFVDTLNRPALAQTFEEIASGEMFTVVVNHLKSKGSDCNAESDPDLLDGQGNCPVTRTNAASALATWLAGDPTGSGDPDVLIISDMNSYAMEDPITTLITAGYTDLLGPSEYSYVFSGEWGYLDHALANTDLEPQVAAAAHWHINADEPSVLDYNEEYKTPNLINILYSAEPYRASDHDPVLVGLNLAAEAVGPEPETGGTAEIGVFDPALSKVGMLPAGGIGLPGEQLTWVITVTNNGTAAGSNIVITDTLRSELRIDSVQTARGSYAISGQTVTFTIPYLNPGESVEMRIMTTVLSSPLGGVFTNQADLAGTAANGDTVTTSVVATLSPATMLPSTGYPPAETPAGSQPVTLYLALAALVVALVAGGLTLRKMTR